MNLVERAKNILLTPTKEWEAIKNEGTSVGELFSKYAVILAAIPAVAGFLGFILYGVSIGHSILWAALQYIFGLVSLYVLAVIVDALAPSFGSTKNMVDSFKVVVYSTTASWVGGVFLLVPSLSPLYFLASIYSLVLFYFGLKTVKNPPQDKTVGYFVVTIIIAIVIFALIGAIVGRFAHNPLSMRGF